MVQLVTTTVVIEVVESTEDEEVVYGESGGVINAVVFVNGVEGVVEAVLSPDVVDATEGAAVTEVANAAAVVDDSDRVEDADDVAGIDVESEEVNVPIDVVEAGGASVVDATGAAGGEASDVVDAVVKGSVGLDRMRTVDVTNIVDGAADTVVVVTEGIWL